MRIKRKREWTEVMIYGFFWLYFSLLYVLIEKALLGDLGYYPVTGAEYSFLNNLSIVVMFSFSTGLVIGMIEVYFLKSYFVRRSFSSKIILKSLFYVGSLVIFLFITAMYGNSRGTGHGMFDPETFNIAVSFLFSASFWILILYIASIVVISLFLIEVRDNLGPNVFHNFLFGKYHKPIEESRVFMFLDMKSSTRIAEELGHIEYFKLLNDYYADLTKAILACSGQIYQYVGDEVVISWPETTAFVQNNCVGCFFRAREIIQGRSEDYKRKYGVCPEFKAGLHCGRVTTGEIGIVKKEIIFTGDVLNTAARIQAMCNTYNCELLASGAIVKRLKTDEGISHSFIGELELRGKHEKVALYSIEAS